MGDNWTTEGAAISMLVRRERDTLKPSLTPALTGEHHAGVVSGKGDS